MASQAVTPELRRWIVEQAQAGHEAQVVLSAMLSSGWSEDVAIAAIESTMQEHLKLVQPALPPAVAVPEPMAHGPANMLDAGDRQVSVVLAMQQPRLLVFADLLSGEECDALIEDARARLTRSLTVVVKDGTDEPNVDRTSHGMFFDRGETPLVQRIEARLARLLGWPAENGEGLQVLQYLPGAEYKPHFDYFEPGESGTQALVQRGGQRVATVIIYLNEPKRGGATVFPDANMELVPRRGHAVFFSYERPHPSTKSLHGGTPVLEGEKWIATKWLRERKYV